MSTVPGDSRNRRKTVRFSPPGSKVSIQSRPFSVENARVDAQKTGTWTGILSKDASLVGLLLDISSHGMRFISDTNPPQGSRLKFTVNFTGIQQPLQCIGTVRWVHQHFRPGEHAVGVEFDPLGENEDQLLRQIRSLEATRAVGPDTTFRHRQAIGAGTPPAPELPRRVPPRETGKPGAFPLTRALLGLLFLAGLGVWVARVVAAPEENLHRFGKGTVWNYAVTQADKTYIRVTTILEEREDGGVVYETYIIQDPSEPRPLRSERYVMRVEGKYLLRHTDADRHYRVYRFGSRKGDTWLTEPKAGSDLKTVHLGRETVSVPAGSFQNVIHVRLTMFEGGRRDEDLYLAPGVGIVKRETAFNEGGSSGRQREKLKDVSLKRVLATVKEEGPNQGK